MIEVEAKAQCSPEIEEKILEMGGKWLGVENHLDQYFNSPQHDFAKTDEALRIRIKEEGARLTYKGPKLDSATKSRKEVTVKVDDPGYLEDILKSLGFSVAAVVKKRRVKYVLEGATLCLDDVKGLGTYLEVELSADDNWEDAKDQVLDIMSKLGLKESIRKSYLELLAERGAKGL